MSRSIKSAVLARWPKDQLRPDLQLQDALNRRLGDRLAGRLQSGPWRQPVAEENAISTAAAVATKPTELVELEQLRQLNALYSLLDDRYKKTSRLTRLMTPQSRPTYYDELITELEEAPKRSFFGRIAKRLGGMFRIS